MSTPNSNARSYRPPGVVVRVFALLIDGLALSIPTMILAMTVSRMTSSTAVLDLVALGTFVIYEVATYACFGKTLGKKAVGLQVTSNLDTLTKPSARQAFNRVASRDILPVSIVWMFVPGASFALFAWTLLILLTIFKDADRRGLHDKLAGTYLVDVSVRRNAQKPG
jgi:uncharacterized RDD family membrane protein YckC